MSVFGTTTTQSRRGSTNSSVIARVARNVGSVLGRAGAALIVPFFALPAFAKDSSKTDSNEHDSSSKLDTSTDHDMKFTDASFTASNADNVDPHVIPDIVAMAQPGSSVDYTMAMQAMTQYRGGVAVAHDTVAQHGGGYGVAYVSSNTPVVAQGEYVGEQQAAAAEQETVAVTKSAERAVSEAPVTRAVQPVTTHWDMSIAAEVGGIDIQQVLSAHVEQMSVVEEEPPIDIEELQGGENATVEYAAPLAVKLIPEQFSFVAPKMFIHDEVFEFDMPEVPREVARDSVLMLSPASGFITSPTHGLSAASHTLHSLEHKSEVKRSLEFMDLDKWNEDGEQGVIKTIDLPEPEVEARVVEPHDKYRATLSGNDLAYYHSFVTAFTSLYSGYKALDSGKIQHHLKWDLRDGGIQLAKLFIPPKFDVAGTIAQKALDQYKILVRENKIAKMQHYLADPIEATHLAREVARAVIEEDDGRLELVEKGFQGAWKYWDALKDFKAANIQYTVHDTKVGRLGAQEAGMLMNGLIINCFERDTPKIVEQFVEGLARGKELGLMGFNHEEHVEKPAHKPYYPPEDDYYEYHSPTDEELDAAAWDATVMAYSDAMGYSGAMGFAGCHSDTMHPPTMCGYGDHYAAAGAA